MEILVNAYWPGNVRELRNLIDSMVVLAPGEKIHASDIPADIRDGGTRMLPMRLPQQFREVPGKELEFILRSLVELKLQVEELRRRVHEAPQVVEAYEVRSAAPVEYEEITVADDVGSPDAEIPPPPGDFVVYRPGMQMSDVEKAAIAAALRETGGNRRKAAANLGIGERTLYRKIKEYELEA
jgi:DNA-binding NtrC family response regulator